MGAAAIVWPAAGTREARGLLERPRGHSSGKAGAGVGAQWWFGAGSWAWGAGVELGSFKVKRKVLIQPGSYPHFF